MNEFSENAVAYTSEHISVEFVLAYEDLAMVIENPRSTMVRKNEAVSALNSWTRLVSDPDEVDNYMLHVNTDDGLVYHGRVPFVPQSVLIDESKWGDE